MPYNVATNEWSLSDKMLNLKFEKEAAYELQSHRHQEWTENYELYRNRVKTNRLTQRQAINVPLMKETIKTSLSNIDDAPNVDWKELSGDEQKELYFQEIWNQQMKDNNVDLVDILDKKNVLLYGFSAKKLNIGEKGIEITVMDVFDILLDPLFNPWDLETSRFVIHQNIFKSVRDILADDKYSAAGKEELKIWAESPPGITQSKENEEAWKAKMERLKSMGVNSDDFGYFAGGDRIVNLTEHFTTSWNNEEKKFERRVVVYADNQVELMDELLEDLIGVDFWPFDVWSEDPETNDVYPDGVGDTVRTPNKVLNVWISQMMENRTLKNFQMHWYLPTQGYKPQTYTPGPGVMLPAPPGEDINKVIRPVEVSGLEDTMDMITAVIGMVERATGVTALQKGESEQGDQTLGEIQTLLSQANERATAMTKFYRLAWYRLAVKWCKMLKANAPKLMKLFKVGRSGKGYSVNIMLTDWQSEAGFEPIVRSTSEQEVNNLKSMQKFQMALAQFPNNTALKQIAQKRMLEVLDLTADEMRQVEEAQKQADELEMQQKMMEMVGQPEGGSGPTAPGAPPFAPAAEVPADQDIGDMEHIMRRMSQINQLS